MTDATTDAGFRAALRIGTPARFTLREVDWNQSGAGPERRGEGEGV